MLYTGSSIVDYLKSIGQDSSYAARSALAAQYGISNYTGTAAQNTQLLGMLNKPPTDTQPAPPSGGGSSNGNTSTNNSATTDNVLSQDRLLGYIKDYYAGKGQTLSDAQAQNWYNEFKGYGGTDSTLFSNMQYANDWMSDKRNSGAVQNQNVNQNVNQNANQDQDNTPLPAPPADDEEDTVAQILAAYQKLIDDWMASGKKITPADITPAQAAQWANQAAAEVDPYYQQQIKAIQSDLNSSFDNLQKEYELTAAEKNAAFRQSLGLQRESEASQGTAFSGGRTAREQSLQSSAQRDFSSLENTTRYNAQKGLNETERTIGSLNLGGISIPKLSSYSASLQGKGGVNQTGSSNLYSPTGGITGSIEFEQANKRREYADLLKYNYLNEYNI